VRRRQARKWMRRKRYTIPVGENTVERGSAQRCGTITHGYLDGCPVAATMEYTRRVDHQLALPALVYCSGCQSAAGVHCYTPGGPTPMGSLPRHIWCNIPSASDSANSKGINRTSNAPENHVGSVETPFSAWQRICVSHRLQCQSDCPCYRGELKEYDGESSGLTLSRPYRWERYIRVPGGSRDVTTLSSAQETTPVDGSRRVWGSPFVRIDWGTLQKMVKGEVLRSCPSEISGVDRP